MRRLLFMAAIAGAADCSSTRPAAPGSPTLAFVDVTVVPMDSERVVAGQTVLISGDRIVAVGNNANVKVPAKAQIVDGKGKFLMPGLMDMHVHLPRVEDLSIYLARGVTTVRNMWGSPLQLEWRSKIARGEMRGPTLYLAGPIVDGPEPAHDGSLVIETADDAAAAVKQHQVAGYDFIKVYSGLSLVAYDALMTSADAAGLKVAGHIPRAAGLVHAMKRGQVSVEHMDGWLDAIQMEDSPVKGEWDQEYRRQKLDHVDESKIAPLAAEMARRHIWNCPTRTVKDQFAPLDEVKRRLAAPEMRYVPACDLATWQPGKEQTPAVLDAFRRANALHDRLIVALRDAGAPLLLGTDTGNPLVVPGFSVHTELAHWVRVGVTPYQALRAATSDAAAFMHQDAEVGTVNAGKRADLLLVDGNPLTDITNAGRISGVMVRGHWMDATELTRMLEHAVAMFSDDKDPFRDQPPLGKDAAREFSATYRITWKDASFGAERIWVGRGDDGERVLHAQNFDLHEGQEVRAHLWPGKRLVLESDGASGRGRVELTPENGQAHAVGNLLSGPARHQPLPLHGASVLGVHQSMIGRLLLVRDLAQKPVGQSTDVVAVEFGLGSFMELHDYKWHVTRLEDVVVDGQSLARVEMKPDKGPSCTVTVDEQGWPVTWEINAWGSMVRYQRL